MKHVMTILMSVALSASVGCGKKAKPDEKQQKVGTGAATDPKAKEAFEKADKDDTRPPHPLDYD